MQNGTVVKPDHTDTVLPTEAGALHEERLYVASAGQLMWWRFRKHRLALICTVIVLLLYVVAALAQFVAPYDPSLVVGGFKNHPPTRIHYRDAAGALTRPFVYGTKRERDPISLINIYLPDTAVTYEVKFLASVDEYRLWGFIPLRWKLYSIGVPVEEQGLFLLGTDRYGRDVFSRAVHGSQLSLSVGLVGVVLSMTMGVILGGLSGYYGGTVDNVIQRAVELLRSIPSIPLWMSLSAAVPPHWPPVRVYFAITVILSFMGWTGMARVVRGRFLSLREEDFVLAARVSGASQLRIILRHMVPCFASHIIASMTLSIPAMILGETSLSFLGLGLREPAVSWGVMLSGAQNVASIVVAPWTMWAPGICVVVAVLAINFVGDGLRDAADPYSR